MDVGRCLSTQRLISLMLCSATSCLILPPNTRAWKMVTWPTRVGTRHQVTIFVVRSFVVWLSVLCPRLWEWLAFSASGWQRANRNRSWYGDPRVDRRNEWFFWSTQVDNYLCVSCVRLPHKLLKQWFCKSCSQSGLKWKAPFRNHFWDSLSLSMFLDFIILLLFWNG